MTPGRPPTPPPPTRRLDWSEPAALKFTAAVTATHGQRVALSASAFYPESGAQNADVGTLHWSDQQSAVTDVQKAGEVVWHTLSGPVPPLGTPVTGEVNAAIRQRHATRHSAEHLLAQALLRINPAYRVRSVAMRGPECTLDLDGGPSLADADRATALLWDAARAGLTLETVQVPETGLERYPLRRPPQVSGTVRVVLFRDPAGEIWEASACGGTHLTSAVQTLPVVVTRLERIRDLTRLTFMAGQEAAEALTHTSRLATDLARSFSVGPARLPERVADLRSSLSAAQTEAQALRAEVARLMLDAAPLVAGQRRISADEALLRPLLELARARPGVSVVVTPSGAVGVACGDGSADARSLLAGWLHQSGGRGGGRPDLAQGTTPDLNAFEAAVRAG